MKKKYYILFLMLFIFVMMLDTKTAINAAASGLDLCLKSVIPSLFPFVFLSSLLAEAMGNQINILGPIRQLCQIPKGCDGIFILGLLGGYPVGAKLIAQQYQSGHLSKQAARRLMGFCNNAGPGFIFGMLWNVFSNKWALWLLWGTQIASSVITGMVLRKCEYKGKLQAQHGTLNAVQTLNQCVRAMGSICGWIIIFRVLIGYLSQWIFSYFPGTLQVACVGVLELINGCALLSTVESEGLRFVLCAAMLSFGGICVLMQTASVTSELGLGFYLPGKLLQTIITIFLSFICQYLLFSNSIANIFPVLAIISFLFTIYFLVTRKNSSISAKYAV